MKSNMPLIAGTYKILGQIGSGGGGIVYLGEHIRLGKKVVLKEDKRTLSAKPEVLRREVDALKNLSHAYIPQVYDFVEQDGTVYTVMNYIDGESFDKPLKRGERFGQAQVIEWACQLLEALIYLHNRPPHGILHADIKPANVMLTPQGDVRLIDFNIALALGEEGAIAVGRSFGYASPEHYGLDYSSGNVTQGVNTDVITDISPNTISDLETVLESKPQPESSSGSSSKKTIMLNVRSDIYSLGATLYHILTGERPAQNASEVKPLSAKKFSPAVIAIISKAMNPDKDLRYQTAKEMLQAFQNLRKSDPRTRGYKRVRFIAFALFALVLAFGIFTSFTGLVRMQAESSALVFVEHSSSALADGDRERAVYYALQALPERNSIFVPRHTAQAQRALADALGVYDLSDGYQAYLTITLPSEPFKIAMAPNGQHGAAVYAFAVAIFNVQSGEIIATLPTVRSALAGIVFVDDNLLLFAGEDGISAYDISAQTILWTRRPATEIAVSADGQTVAGIYRDESFATIYNIDGTKRYTVYFDGRHQRVIANDIFANPGDNLLALNRDGSWLAVSFSDGALIVFDPSDAENYVLLFDETDFEADFVRYEGGFYAEFFAFSVTEPSGQSLFAVINMDEFVQEGGFDSTKPFGVITNEDGIFLSNNDVIVNIHPVTGEQTEVAYTSADVRTFAVSKYGVVVATVANDFVFFDRNARVLSEHNTGFTNCDFVSIGGNFALVAGRDTPVIRVLRRNTFEQANFFHYTVFYHDQARINAEGTKMMMFHYQGFRLYNINGTLIREQSIPDAQLVVNQQHSKASGNLAVLYRHALRIYSGVDGSLMFEQSGLQSTFYASYGISILEQDGTMRLIDIDTGEVLLSKTAQGNFAAYAGILIDETFLNGGELIGATRIGEDYVFVIRRGSVCVVYKGDGNKKFEVPAIGENIEAFFTSNAVIISPLHGTPLVYCLSSGEFITNLEVDSFLTYIKEIYGYVISQYITADGRQYAILLDPVTYQPLAMLPQFTDITSSNELLFDNRAGTIRKSHIYSIEALIHLAVGGDLF